MPTATLPQDVKPVLILDGGPDEGSADAFMTGVRSVQTEAAAVGVDLRWRFKNPVEPGWRDIGSFIIEHGGNGLTVIASLLVAWLASRNGRKVSLEIGHDLKAEASSTEEVRKLLDIAQQHRDAVAARQRKPKKRTR